jgi:hypothetical protein
MALVYETEQIRTGFQFFNPHKMNPVKQWLKHYENWCYLSFIHNNTKSGSERRQANKEIHIAQKKMDYWYKLAEQVSLKDLEEGKKKVDEIWAAKR